MITPASTYHKYTVSVALVWKERIFLCRRKNTTTFPNRWQFPGGKMEEYETNSEAARREVFEETGLNIEPHRFMHLQAIYGDPSTYCCYLYWVLLKDDEFPEHKEEDKHGKWYPFTFDLAYELDLMPGIKTALGTLKRIVALNRK